MLGFVNWHFECYYDHSLLYDIYNIARKRIEALLDTQIGEKSTLQLIAK